MSKRSGAWLVVGLIGCFISGSVGAEEHSGRRAERPAAGEGSVSTASARPGGAFGKQVLLLEEPFAVPNYAFEEAKLDGTRVDRALNEYGGRVIVLNFWATWCGVCKRELPKLDRLAGRVKGSAIDLVALSIDDDFELARRVMKKRGYQHLGAFHDSQSVLSTTFGVRGVPTTFVVGPDGRARAVVQGPADWDSQEAIDWLTGLTSNPPLPLPAPAAPTTAANHYSR